MSTTKTRSPLQERLVEIEDQLTDERDERKALAQERAEAKRAFAVAGTDPKSPEFKKASRLIEAVKLKDEKISQLEAAQIETLKVLSGDAAGSFGGTVSGWADVAREIDLERGQTSASVSASSLLREAYAGVTSDPATGLGQPSRRGTLAQRGQDRRFVYPVLPVVKIDGGGRELAVTEFRQTGDRTVTGSVERDPAATTQKAELDLTIELATESIRQLAAVVSNVPNALFGAEPALTGFLESEMRYQLDLALDAHVLAQISDAAPPFGQVGANLIDQVRAAVSEARANGANPTVLVIDAADAVALDTFTTGADDAYAFLTSTTGSSSPLWGLQVVESPIATDPLLLDPQLLGVLYAAMGRIEVDPFSGFDTNTSRVRVEIEALAHIRDANGAYRIAAA